MLCGLLYFPHHRSTPQREVVRAARRELWASDLVGILPLVLSELLRAPGNPPPPPATRREPWSYLWLHRSHAFQAAVPEQGLHFGSAADQLCALWGYCPLRPARHRSIPLCCAFLWNGVQQSYGLEKA